MKTIYCGALFLLAAFSAAAQVGSPLPSTSFTRDVLRATNAPDFMARAGLSTNLTFTNLNGLAIDNTTGMNADAIAATNQVTAAAGLNSGNGQSWDVHPAFPSLWTRLHYHTSPAIIAIIGDSYGSLPCSTIRQELLKYMPYNGAMQKDNNGTGSPGIYYYATGGGLTDTNSSTTFSVPENSILRSVGESGDGTYDDDFWDAHVHIWSAGGTNAWMKPVQNPAININQFKLFYGGDPSGTGSIAIQTNIGGGSWVTMTNLNTEANYDVKTYSKSLGATPTNWQFRVISLTGTNVYYGTAMYANTPALGFVIANVTSPGIECFGNMTKAGKTSVSNFWATINPDIVIFAQKKGDTNGTWVKNLRTNAWAWMVEACPNADWVAVLPDIEPNGGTYESKSIYDLRLQERFDLKNFSATNNIRKMATYDTAEWGGLDTNVTSHFSFYQDATHLSDLGRTYAYRGLPDLMGINPIQMRMAGIYDLAMMKTNTSVSLTQLPGDLATVSSNNAVNLTNLTHWAEFSTSADTALAATNGSVVTNWPIALAKGATATAASGTITVMRDGYYRIYFNGNGTSSGAGFFTFIRAETNGTAAGGIKQYVSTAAEPFVYSQTFFLSANTTVTLKPTYESGSGNWSGVVRCRFGISEVK